MGTFGRLLAYGLPPEQEYSILISHCWGYNDDYLRLRRLLDAATGFRWRNLSIEKDNPVPRMEGLDRSSLTVFRTIERKIIESDCLLVMLGMYAKCSDWIQTEITLAQEVGVPLIGIRLHGAERSPVNIRNAMTDTVSWSTSSIVASIRQHAIKRAPPAPSTLMSLKDVMHPPPGMFTLTKNAFSLFDVQPPKPTLTLRDVMNLGAPKKPGSI